MDVTGKFPPAFSWEARSSRAPTTETARLYTSIDGQQRISTLLALAIALKQLRDVGETWALNLEDPSRGGIEVPAGFAVTNMQTLRMLAAAFPSSSKIPSRDEFGPLLSTKVATAAPQQEAWEALAEHDRNLGLLKGQRSSALTGARSNGLRILDTIRYFLWRYVAL